MKGDTLWRYRGAAPASYGSVPHVTFDAEYELLWTGDQYGYLTSFIPDTSVPGQEAVTWHTYSSFRGFKEPCLSLHSMSIAPGESLICAASATAVRASKPGGFPVLRKDFGPNTLQKRVQHMAMDPSASRLLLAGETPGLIALQCNEGRAAEPLLMNGVDISPLSCFRVCETNLVTGSHGGEVSLRPLSDLSLVTHTIRGFPGKVLSACKYENFVFVSAFADRMTSAVRIYDLRALDQPVQKISLPGIIVNSVPYSVGGVPACIALTATQGFYVVNPTSALPQFSSGAIEGTMGMTSCALSRSSSSLVVSNDCGGFYAFAETSTGDFCNTDVRKHAPHAKPASLRSWSREVGPEMGFDPACDPSTLLSNWPPDNYMLGCVELKGRQLPQTILSRMQLGVATMNYIGVTRPDVYLPDPKDLLGTVLPDPYPFNEKLGDDPVAVPPLLRELRQALRTSARGRSAGNSYYYSKPDEAQQVCYASGFDWASVNQSKDVVGLDNSYEESWLNPLLQCMYHVHAPFYPVRRALVHHVCKKRFCVTCEIGILFTNMQIQSTQTASACPIVQPHNVIRTLRQQQELLDSQLFERPQGRDDAVAKIHALQRKLLEIMDEDIRGATPDRIAVPPTLLIPEYGNIIASLFGTELAMSKSTLAPQLHWDVPASATKVDEGLQHLLKKLEMYNSEPATIRRLPPILVLLLNPEHGHLQPPSNLKFSRGKEEFNYVLNSSILHLAYDKDDPGHFVNHIRSPHGDQFFIINDYLVSPLAKEDTLQSHIPPLMSHATVVAYYALQDFKPPRYQTRNYDDRLPMHEVFSNILQQDPFVPGVSQKLPPSDMVPLSNVALSDIHAGDIIALDAEYVMLRWGNDRDEVASVRRERNPLMTLARLSCILSQTEGDERVISDDYVATPEPVLDYVTKYSGISAGDLDAETSFRRLTALKATYLKLRVLLDKGVRFLGHGLAQDFRVLNIAVPQSQILDTVEIFRKPGGRKLRLRFLAYFLLGESVQEDEHDSVEDARTALRLYRKYEELLGQGTFDQTLDLLMLRGSETNWHVPGDGPPVSVGSGARSKFRTLDTPSPPPPPELISELLPTPKTPQSFAPRVEDDAAAAVAQQTPEPAQL